VDYRFDFRAKLRKKQLLQNRESLDNKKKGRPHGSLYKFI